MRRLLVLALLPGAAFAAVIGHNTPAPKMSVARLAELPAAQRPAWQAYLERSDRQAAFDRATLARELKPGDTVPPPPVAGKTNAPLDREPAWYASAEAQAIATTILSFQTPSGGWSKNQNRAGPPRLPGQRYANNAETMTVGSGSFDEPRDRFWTFVGTLDNDATHTEIRFLARVNQQRPKDEYRAAIQKGVLYMLTAQYPNGGWPQNYPLEGGFHDGITFNDEAVSEAAALLQDVAEAKPEFAFVPAPLRHRAAAAAAKAVDLILAAQVKVDGRLTVWPQQIDALTLAPISARNYEPRGLASAESAGVLLFLMHQPRPTPAMKAAVEAGIAWLKAHALYDHAFAMTPDGRKLVSQPGAGPLWSRVYDVSTGRPIFGDWGKTIHDDVNEISKGRRNGYTWWGTWPQKALDAYPRWKASNP
ncbi:pectate lyase [Roseateles asaccharophilus]|uniref:PelA/Pel-15E family pectate lyase n=1 Tax=Roseateles asaccharophilus TaxID=582607 RepID=A0ABU2A8B8_9BURK|nr:pectate lyase [Roseateles asaccharophilus]MDR7333439.1 PelA/Pel-15E family pectate lyase [Roseateles asaccharophilus]